MARAPMGGWERWLSCRAMSRQIGLRLRVSQGEPLPAKSSEGSHGKRRGGFGVRVVGESRPHWLGSANPSWHHPRTCLGDGTGDGSPF